MNEPIQLYLNVDAEGNIKSAYSGQNIVATEQYDYFFIVDDETANTAGLFKVEIENMQPKLVKKTI